jgi:hypothetical protein
MLNDRPEEQDIVFREVLLKKLSVREVERISRKIATEKVRKQHFIDGDAELQAIEREFTETLGTRVQILRTEYGGRMTIDYFSQEDLRKILEMIHRGDADQTYTKSEKEIIGKLTASVPLVVASPDLTPAAVPASSGTSEEPLMRTPVSPSISLPPSDPTSLSHEEEIFTRHDTLDVPATPPEVLDAEIATEPVIDEVEDESLYSLRNFSL